MTINVNRRQFVIGSPAVIAQMGIAQHVAAQAPKLFRVSTVDSLTLGNIGHLVKDFA